MCGFAGRSCALDDYPDCDRSSMKGVTALPDDSSADRSAWVDRWVGETADIGGICRLPGNRWAMYFSPEARPPSPDEAEDAGPASDAGVAGASAPIAETEDEPEDGDFIDGWLRSAQGFVDDLIPKREQKDAATYGTAGAIALVVIVGASLFIRSIRRGRAKGKVEAKVEVEGKAGKKKGKAREEAPVETPPPKMKSPNYEVAERLQLMFAVHGKLADMPWYEALPNDMKYLLMRSYTEEGALLVGLRSQRPLPVRLVREMVDGESSTVIEQDGKRVTIRRSDLADAKKVGTLALLYDSILHEVQTIKGMGSQVVDMDRVDPHALTRALLMDMQLNLASGEWDRIHSSFVPGGTGLEGPIPPDMVIQRARQGWGMEGRGDPFSPLSNGRRQRGPRPQAADGARRGELGMTLGHSAFWGQLVTSEWYVDLDPYAKEAIEGRQQHIEDCLHNAYDDPLFRERLVKDTQFTEEGLKVVVSEVLSASGVDILRDGRFAPLSRRERGRERVEDSWTRRFRDLVKSTGK